MNRVILIGNVGTEPEVRYYDADQATARFRLATTERAYTLQNGTQVPERTEWHNVLMWRNLAKKAEQYIHKGDRVIVIGKIRYTSYDNNRGHRQYVTEIIAESLELLTSMTLAPKEVPQQNVEENTGDDNDENNVIPF